MNQKKVIEWQNLNCGLLSDDEQLAKAWDSLNHERSELPFLDSSVMSLALKQFGDGHERLLVGRTDNEIVAILLVVPHGKFRWMTFQPSQIPLGAWVAKRSISPSELARSICRGPLGFCLGVSLTQIDPLLAPRTTDAEDSETSDYIETAWIDVTGSFEEYWAARGKNLRQNMRKQRNKLESDGIITKLRSHVSVAEMAACIERYGTLESVGWKAEKGTAIHPGNAQGRFYRNLFEQAAEKNEAVVYEYLFGERTVAMNLCLLRHGVLIVLKTTYDETIPSTYSPAFLLRQEELMTFFGNNRVKRIEYFGRLMDWHTKLTENKRTLYHLTVYRSSLIKKLAQWRRKRAAQLEVAEPITA